MFSELYCICLGKTAYNGLFQVIFIILLPLLIHWLLVLGQAGKSKAELLQKVVLQEEYVEAYLNDMHMICIKATESCPERQIDVVLS